MKPTAYLSTLLSGAALVAAIGLAQPAQAVPITYALSGFLPPDPFLDGFIGTFTFDSAVPSLLSVDITVAGPFLPDVFTVPVSASAPHTACGSPLVGGFGSPPPGSCFVAEDTSGSEALVLSFAQLLSTGSDPGPCFAVGNVVGDRGEVSDGCLAFGEAVPQSAAVPEPATLSLFGAALVGLGLGLVRRRRRSILTRTYAH